MRMAAAVILLASLLAGCLDGGSSTDSTPATIPPSQQEDPNVQVTCRVVDTAGEPLVNASCGFVLPNGTQYLAVDADGQASVFVERGTLMLIRASASGYEPRSESLTANGDTTVTFPLSPLDDTDPSAMDGKESITIEGDGQGWIPPVEVTDRGNEPHLVVAPSGTIYYAPTASLGTGLLRSVDDGLTWQSIEPTYLEALPVLGGDTSVSVAPDGSVWYARYFGYPDGTIGCTSTDEGDSWQCDNLAIPGVTDRMWIVGIDAQEGYLQTNQGLYVNTYAYTDSGSLRYTPHGVSSHLVNVRNGNMVYDAVSDGVYQVMQSRNILLLHIDGSQGIISSKDTGVPGPDGLPWLSVTNGVFWTTGEPERQDGSRDLILARSTDQGESWDQFPIQSQAKSITFSFVSSGPDGRVAAAYYGSDTEGPPDANGGTWSLYVVETSNGNDPYPVWKETLLVKGIHVGSVCTGAACSDTGDDPDARFSGDLIGSWIDETGRIHIAYNDDTNEGVLNRYIRQV